MKQLSSVVFMDSARIPYQEFRLDGNIHFIGTQGVGKSTVLRAILFFYTADSRRLGISKEQKPFAEYYFPHINSYVVYEVTRDERKFCVWLQRRQNRLVFRFIDGPYDKAAFIASTYSGENGESGQLTIQNEDDVIKACAAKGVKVEKQLTNKEFLDIIYGANRKMLRYSLLQSMSYQNIPRTISNIFQNSSLDASFIKQTIIHSLTDNPHVINLETNRHHLETAKKDYTDVLAFKNHERQARNIVAAYRDIQEIEETIRRIAWNIGAAYNYSMRQNRQLDTQVQEKQQAVAQKQAERQKAMENAQKDMNSLHERIGVVKRNIRHANERRKFYEEKDMQRIISEHDKKAQYQSERRQKAQTLENLTQRHADTQKQYDYALRDIDQRLGEDKQALWQQISTAKEAFHEQKEAEERSHQEHIAQVKDEYRQALDEISGEIRELDLQLQSRKQELKQVRQKEYFKEEKGKLRDGLHRKAQEKAVTQEQLSNHEQEQKWNKERWKNESEQTEQAYSDRLEKLSEAAQALKNDAETVEAQLKAYDQTLLAYLDSQKPQWRQNIGRVVPEAVLMRTDTQPRLSDGADLFGISLNLNKLEATQLSKDALENRLQVIHAERKKTGQQQQEVQQELEKARKRLKKKYASQADKLTETLKKHRYALEKLEIELENQQNQQKRLEEKAEEQREADIKALRETLSSLEQQRQQKQTQHEQTQQALNAKRQEAEKALQKRIKSLKNKRDEAISAANKEIENLTANTETEKAELIAQRDKALKEKGADTGVIQDLEHRLNELDAKIKWLEAQSELIFSYQKDYREYIGRLDAFKQERKLLEDKINRRQENLDARLKAYDQAIEELQEARDSLKNRQRHHQKQIRLLDEDFRPQQLYHDYKGFVENEDIHGENSVEQLTQQLYSNNNKQNNRQKRLQERVSEFAGHFSPDNILNFPEKVQTIDESMRFAAMLTDFTEHQKILDYEAEVNKKYAMVLEHIGRETDALLEHEEQVRGVIKRINQDFRQSNFVGVVHAIEMRTRDSEHPLMQILRAIQEFRRENPYDYGQPNLFTSENKQQNERHAVQMLEELYTRMNKYRERQVRLEDAFELEFRIRENENDTDWVNRLANVGSNGTDVLVKSMVYINLLNIFKKHETRKTNDSKLHCLIDEVGVLHDSNVKGLINFASARNIHLINGSPNSHNEEDYRHIYEFMKEPKTHNTRIVKLLSHEG